MTATPTSRRDDLAHARHALDHFSDALAYATRDPDDDGAIGDPNPSLAGFYADAGRHISEIYSLLDEMTEGPNGDADGR
jgi:hypothetical protein